VLLPDKISIQTTGLLRGGVLVYMLEGVAMIKSIQFKNFKSLRDTELPLSPCTILVGQNGSGKSTVLKALKLVQHPNEKRFSDIATFGVEAKGEKEVCIEII
jgi:DNA repair exonuclease SbcCD ATPase subunit